MRHIPFVSCVRSQVANMLARVPLYAVTDMRDKLAPSWRTETLPCIAVAVTGNCLRPVRGDQSPFSPSAPLLRFLNDQANII
jgi:hypothetical protein